MAYDPVAESVVLIEARRAEPVGRLSRRRRFAAMAVDVVGDLAVTMFARRGVGCTWKEMHVLAFRDGEWRLLGGGGSSGGEEDLLADRPVVLPSFLGVGGEAVRGADPGVMVVSGSGGVLDDGDGPAPWPRSGEWISYADVRVSARVASVQIADRSLLVPWHGHVVVAWSGHPSPRVVALDEVGTPLSEALLTSRR